MPEIVKNAPYTAE